MEEMIEYILQFGNLNKQQIELVKSKGKSLHLKRDEYFSEAEKVPKEVAFVVEGVFRGCYYNSKGEEITRCFISENSLMCDYQNFDSNTVSSEYLQAVTNSKLIVFSKKDWDELSFAMVEWDNIKHKMVQLCMYQKSRKNPVISQDATTRYLEFIEDYPSIINRTPLTYIASYLGVTLQSLSRIRKNIK